MSGGVGDDPRARLALACRVLSDQGHDHFFLGHVSARDASGDAAWVWIKPSGLGLGEVQADDLALMDLDGRQLRGDRPLHNEMPIHTEIYRRRPDVGAVVHTHAFYTAALTATDARFEFVSQAPSCLPMVSACTAARSWSSAATKASGWPTRWTSDGPCC